jgi:CRISPR/Cas system CSM-associated protein Csm2 small subunit
VDGRVAEIEKGNFTPEMADAVEEITRDQAAANPAGTSLEEVENLTVNKAQELYSEVVERDRKQLVELEERVKLKNNLILFQLAQKKNPDRESRAKEDNEQINRLLAEIKVDHRPLTIVESATSPKRWHHKTRNADRFASPSLRRL